MDTPEKKSEELKTAQATAANLVVHAAKVAEDLTKKTDERVTQSLIDALKEVFGEHKRTQRFVDVTRIPLICANIIQMHDDIKEIKEAIKDDHKNYVNQDQFEPIKKVIYGLVALILIGVVGAILTLVIK